ncbi:MAG: hypothetical protein ACOVNU_10895 [Candidatus Kapaibacteriota bacterium]|jgi:hypothetical protein
MEKRKFLNIITSSSIGLGLITLLPKNLTKNLELNTLNTKSDAKNKFAIKSDSKININSNPLAVKRNNKGIL